LIEFLTQLTQVLLLILTLLMLLLPKFHRKVIKDNLIPTLVGFLFTTFIWATELIGAIHLVAVPVLRAIAPLLPLLIAFRSYAEKIHYVFDTYKLNKEEFLPRDFKVLLFSIINDERERTKLSQNALEYIQRGLGTKKEVKEELAKLFVS
jgi:hypothetical protein